MGNFSHSLNRTDAPLTSLSRASQESGQSSYYYNGEAVQVVVVFDEGQHKTAIVENANGDQFDVPMNELRTA